MGKNRIEAVVWDLGNVVVRWDRTLLYRQLFSNSDQGRDEMRAFLTDVLPVDEFNVRVDLGEDVTELCDEYVARHPDVDPSLIHAYAARWTEMIGGYIDGTVQLLAAVQGVGIPCYALSNWGRSFPEAAELYPVFHTFTGRVVSYEVGLVKPDRAIFDVLLKKFDLRAEQCLFIDDNADNIAAARSMGFAVHHFAQPEALREDLLMHGVLVA
jgi:2-haloacid dehalogenase